jgi:putative ABC transport system permease protein
LGGVTTQIEVATIAVVVIGMLLTILIVVLFMMLRLTKDISQIAVMKALGFTNFDIRKQYLYKIGMISITGIFVGTFISNILGESIVSLALSMTKIGIYKITFIINPGLTFIIVPFMLFTVSVGMTWISTSQLKEYNIISLINE